MTKMHRMIRLAASISLGLLFAAGAGAAYPDKPIRIVLPYPPGGGGDVVLRTIQPALEKRLGQSIVIDYRPGAGGNIGAMEVLKAAPDGYTLLMGATNNYVINQFLFANMGFDPLQAFAPITMLVDQPYLVMISAGVPAQSFAEFASYARANPGKLNYGSPGNATVPHLSALMLSDYLGARMTHVPFKGAQPGLQALVANDVQLFIASYSIVAGHMGAGKVRALAVAAQERLAALPNVPTVAEAGIPAGLILGNWWGLAAPRGTEAAILERLAQEIRAVVADPEMQKKFTGQGAIPIANSPAEFAERMRSEAQAWKGIIDKTGAKLDN